MMKGYEFARGQYVLFTNEEIKALEEESSRMIEIVEFVPLAGVDPVYFERAYYLGPDKGGDKPYKLLARAMAETGRCALARYAARGKQYLVLVRPFEDGLLMQQLRYADEVKSFDEVERIDATLSDAELALAVQLIEQIATEEFRPDVYEDAVKKRLEEVIAQKVDGAEVTYAPADRPRAQVIDLMEALKASLEPQSTKGAKTAARKGPKRSGTSKDAAPRRKSAGRGRGSSKQDPDPGH
jgi:DNA end-binding protein Ku